MKIFLDTMSVIYYVERVAPWEMIIRGKMLSAGASPVITDLTRMECIVKPLRLNDPLLLKQFKLFFSNCVVGPLNAAVFDRAAEIRALFGFKPVDSIHLSAAVEAKCDCFLTNDRQLAAYSGIAIDLI